MIVVLYTALMTFSFLFGMLMTAASVINHSVTFSLARLMVGLALMGLGGFMLWHFSALFLT